jgi:hypothetical protein
MRKNAVNLRRMVTTVATLKTLIERNGLSSAVIERFRQRSAPTVAASSRPPSRCVQIREL